jgi:hypothetical protein
MFEGQPVEVVVFMVIGMTVGSFAIIIAMTELIKSAYRGHMNKQQAPYREQIRELNSELRQKDREIARFKLKYEGDPDKEELEFQRIREILRQQVASGRKLIEMTSNLNDPM